MFPKASVGGRGEKINKQTKETIFSSKSFLTKDISLKIMVKFQKLLRKMRKKNKQCNMFCPNVEFGYFTHYLPSNFSFSAAEDFI